MICIVFIGGGNMVCSFIGGLFKIGIFVVIIVVFEFQVELCQSLVCEFGVVIYVEN